MTVTEQNTPAFTAANRVGSARPSGLLFWDRLPDPPSRASERRIRLICMGTRATGSHTSVFQIY